jgi:hypothetical protein
VKRRRGEEETRSDSDVVPRSGNGGRRVINEIGKFEDAE